MPIPQMPIPQMPIPQKGLKGFTSEAALSYKVYCWRHLSASDCGAFDKPELCFCAWLMSNFIEHRVETLR